MNNNLPLVTVIITAYNASQFIKEAILSIINQTYTNLEIIIVDDGSTDNTHKIAEYYSLIDQRIKLFKLNRNSGPSIASNLALEGAKGDFIARMDADDVAYLDRIEKQVDFLLKNPDVVIVGGQCILINKNGEIIGEKKFPLKHFEIYRSLFRLNPIQHPSSMFRKNLKEKAIKYHNHSVLAHDLELVFEIAQYGKLANLEDFILYYRQSENSLSLKNPKETFKATVDIRKKAVRNYGYKPSFSSFLIHYLQIITIFFLPNRAIRLLFEFIRCKKEINLNLNLTFRWLYSLLLK